MRQMTYTAEKWLLTIAEAQQRRERSEQLIAAIRESERQLAAEMAAEKIDMRDRMLALIRELRDTTQSRSTYERCVAIVGERAP